MTPFLRTLIVSFFLGLVVSGAAFTSTQQTKSATASPKTVMHFKFLKEMGLEKPSWLPDFGGKKEEEEATPAPEAAAEDGETEGEEAAAESEE